MRNKNKIEEEIFMYKITEIDGEILNLDNEGFKDYLTEALNTRGAKNEDIEEIDNDIRALKDNESYAVMFDDKKVFTVVKETLKEFYGAVSLTARLGFFVKAEDEEKAEDTVFEDIEGIQLVLKDGSTVEISDINWDLINEARTGNVSQPNVSNFEIHEEKE
jgi:hypothetical protein